MERGPSMRTSGFYLGLALTLSCAPAAAQRSYASQLFQSLEEPGGITPPFMVPQTITVGKKYWQKVDFFQAGTAKPAPLVVFLNKGSSYLSMGSGAEQPNTISFNGWPRARMHEAGYAVAFVPFDRYLAKAGEMADYYASAIAYLRADASKLHIDPNRIILIGVGFDAHFAALLGTDPEYFEKAGVPFDSIRGVVSLWGTGFDIPLAYKQYSYADRDIARTFGKDPDEQRHFSPVAHLDPPNAPAFLMLSGPNDTDSRRDSKVMADALAQAGIPVSNVDVAEHHRGDRKTYFMLEPDGNGREIVPFLQAQFGDSDKGKTP